MNAAVAQRVPLTTILQHTHTVSVCLSKVWLWTEPQRTGWWTGSNSCCSVLQGLGAPVGTLLAGPKEFISQARRYRKALGGGMRQAGIIAAAGRVALLEMSGRLEEDHHHAKTFARGQRCSLTRT